MTAFFQFALVILLLNNCALLAVGRLRPLVRLTAFQGVLLAAVLALMPRPAGSDLTHVLLLAGAVLTIKAVGFPWLLRRTLRRITADPQLAPHLSYSLSVAAGMAGLIFSLWLETRLPVDPGLFPPLLFPAALTTLFAGLLLVVGRMKALTQVIGYLVAENGIFLLGIPLMMEGSVWFELSLLLDIFVAVFVMGIAINHISATFESIDVGRFCSLKD